MRGRTIAGGAAALLAAFLLTMAAGAPVASADEDLAGKVETLTQVVTEQQRELAELRAQVAAAAQSDEERKLTERERELISQAIREILDQEYPRRDNDLRVYWQDGIRLDTRDGKFKLKIGGRVHHDWWWIDGGSRGIESKLGSDLEDGTGFRRARINIEGLIYENTEFKLQLDFAGGTAAFRDVYLRMLNLPVVGSLTVGQFKEPFGLEELTSSNYITFIERSLASTFMPSRNAGVMVNNALLNKRMTWAAGLFRNTNDQGREENDGGYGMTARVTGLPWYKDNGRKLLHLGAAFSLRHPEDPIRFRARPELGHGERLIDTGSFAADWEHRLGAEAALVHGPFSVQGEYIANMVKSSAGGDPTFHAFYVQAGYFLTGEHRPYSTSSGSFGRVKPKRNFRQDGGKGAWELSGRYSYLNLDDGRIRGGEMQSATIGLNWYLNPNIRLMWNYIRACVDRDWSAATNVLVMRLQVDF